MTIATQCMTANIQIGTWLGRRLDREASRTLTREAHAEGDAARVNKHLVPKEALQPIVSAATAVRSHYYDKTLPWKDSGDRLLTRKMYQTFIAEHERLAGEFYAQVEHFLSVTYPVAREQARFRMGTLFDPDDYPEAYTLRRKFTINLDIDVVTEANDFRVQMDNDAVDKIRDKMESAMQVRINKAMADVWSRLATTLSHFAEKMGSDGIFRDTTVKNLEEIVEMLPALNITDDPDLEAIRQDIAKSLVGYDPKDLRKNADVRTAAATASARIVKGMSEMEGFMKAMGNAA